MSTAKYVCSKKSTLLSVRKNPYFTQLSAVPRCRPAGIGSIPNGIRELIFAILLFNIYFFAANCLHLAGTGPQRRRGRARTRAVWFDGGSAPAAGSGESGGTASEGHRGWGGEEKGGNEGVGQMSTEASMIEVLHQNQNKHLKIYSVIMLRLSDWAYSLSVYPCAMQAL